MVSLSSPMRVFASLLIVVLLSLAAAPVHAGPGEAGTEQPRSQLLPPIQDPDDDNDGVDDRVDPEPTNPDVAPPAEPNVTSPTLDSDSDGLPNIQDPDDDNAGVADQEDPAPFDPNIEPTPPSSGHDDDGDGIPDLQDPDDDNDGVADNEEERAAPGSGAGGDAIPGGSGGGAPVVTALPSTGDGVASAASTWAIPAVSTCVMGLLLALSIRLRGRDAA